MQKFLNCNCSETWGNAGVLLLRIVVGAIFVYHGWSKIGMDALDVAAFFKSVGIPAANLFAVIVPWAELIGGLVLILGVFTHWAAKVLAIIAFVALITVHIENGFNAQKGGYEFMLLIFAASLSVMTTGAGKYSLDHYWRHRT